MIREESLFVCNLLMLAYGIYELGEIMKDFAAKVPTQREKQDLERYQKARDLLMSKDLKESEKEKLMKMQNYDF